MKKKITAIFLCIALAATAIVGASLAYFTDTDNATNTFTVGNVDIKLIEQETVKDKDGKVTSLQSFTPNKTLMPGTSSDGNAVSKIITVKNETDQDAWVWVELKIPAALIAEEFKHVGYPYTVDKETGKNHEGTDANNSLHINEYAAFLPKYYGTTDSAKNDGILNAENKPIDSNMVGYTKENCWNGFNVVDTNYVDKDGNAYVILRSAMVSPLKANKTSLPCLRQVYMDWRVTAVQSGADTNGNPTYKYKLVNSDKATYTGSWEIEVNAYAIQAKGISSVDNAIDLYAMNTTDGVNGSITDKTMTSNKAKAGA